MMVWMLVINFRAKVPKKLNGQDELFFKLCGIFDLVSIVQSPDLRIFFRFSLQLFSQLKMMKTQNSYFAENVTT